jgi:hypothetical protein
MIVFQPRADARTQICYSSSSVPRPLQPVRELWKYLLESQGESHLTFTGLALNLRYRHREGLGDLHQYVIEEDPVRVKPVIQQPQKGPKVINLDDRYVPLIILIVKRNEILISDHLLCQLPNRNGLDHLISLFTSRRSNCLI